MNLNEFVEDGKRYIKEIKWCICNEKFENFYEVKCKIIQRGVHDYTYATGSDFLQRCGSKKGFFLTKEAKTTVAEAIAGMEEKIAEMKKESKDQKENDTFFVIYRYTSTEHCDYLLRRKGDVMRRYYRFHQTLEEMERELKYIRYLNGMPEKENDVGLESLEDDPIYRAAKRYGDEKMILALKIYHHVATAKECTAYSGLIGCTVLPSLPETFDKVFTVDASTIDCSVLYRSGYSVLHRPAFAMKGSTHSKWQLNPHTKHAVDAARTNDPAISFADYLAVFGDCATKENRDSSDSVNRTETSDG